MDRDDEWIVKFNLAPGGFMDAAKIEDGYIILNGWPDIWLTKIDRYGNLIWQKCISSGSYEVPWSIIEIDDGFVIGGMKGRYESDIFLLKTDKSGEIIWKKTYGEKNVNEFGGRVIKATNGFLVVGKRNDIIWVIKTDENGNEIWNKTYSRGAFEGGARIIKIEDGYLIGGWGEPGSYLLKIDNEGNIIWYCNYLGKDPVVLDIGEADDGYVAAGYTYTKTIGDSDGWLFKVDKGRGDRVIWMKNFGGRGGDGIEKVFVENKSYILLEAKGEVDRDVGIIIKCADYIPPEINITRPKENYLYIFDREIMPYDYTLIIGKITIVVDVYNPSDAEIKRVEFYIDKKEYTYEPVKTLYSPPYEWTVDFPITGWITLTAGLYYGGCEGVVAKHKEMRIIKLI